MSFIAGILTLFCSIMSWRWPRVYKTFKNLTGNYYQGTSVPFPAHQPCLREWRWRITPNLHTETTFNSPYKLGPFGKWGHFFRNYVPGKIRCEPLLKVWSSENLPFIPRPFSNQSQERNFMGKQKRGPPMCLFTWCYQIYIVYYMPLIN